MALLDQGTSTPMIYCGGLEQNMIASLIHLQERGVPQLPQELSDENSEVKLYPVAERVLRLNRIEFLRLRTPGQRLDGFQRRGPLRT